MRSELTPDEVYSRSSIVEILHHVYQGISWHMDINKPHNIQLYRCQNRITVVNSTDNNDHPLFQIKVVLQDGLIKVVLQDGLIKVVLQDGLIKVVLQDGLIKVVLQDGLIKVVLQDGLIKVALQDGFIIMENGHLEIFRSGLTSQVASRGDGIIKHEQHEQHEQQLYTHIHSWKTNLCG